MSAVMTTGTSVCVDVVTAELVLNKWLSDAVLVAVNSLLVKAAVPAVVPSVPAGLCVPFGTLFPGSSVRSGDAEVPA